ncbi:MAG: hypothetical protein IJ496_04660 [Ruminococcus sp.]|nr:hypothetical protein [Ruminococcus sp.]
MKKKIFAFMLAASTLTLCGCQKEGNTVWECGYEITQIMEEMVQSEDYTAMMSTTDAITEAAGRIGAGDYSSPVRTFKVNLPENLLTPTYEAMGIDPDSFSEGLQKNVSKKTLATATVRMNQNAGTAMIAACSVYSASSSFSCDDLKEDTIYIYTYEKGYPIAVILTESDPDVVQATGCFLLDQNMTCESAEDVEAFITGFSLFSGCTVEEIDNK